MVFMVVRLSFFVRHPVHLLELREAFSLNDIVFGVRDF